MGVQGSGGRLTRIHSLPQYLTEHLEPTKCSKTQNILREIMPHSPQEIQLEIHLLRKRGVENGMHSLVTKSYLTLLKPYEL